MSLAIVFAAAGWGPSGEGEVTPEQLEYSKKLYGEGEAAMAAENYAEALQKFQQGYQYAPHLHMFTFNIASAADAAGDCGTALKNFQMFVDLVPKHPKLKEAKKRLAGLKESCTATSQPAPTGTAPAVGDGESPSAGGSKRLTREEREAIRAMQTAVDELQEGQARYARAKTRHSSIKAFAKAAKRKKKQNKLIRKIVAEEGVEVELKKDVDIDIPDDPKKACAEAESQEKRVIEAMETVIDLYDSAKTYRWANKILKQAERRDKVAFDACG